MTKLLITSWYIHLSKKIGLLNLAFPKESSSSLGYLLTNDQDKWVGNFIKLIFKTWIPPCPFLNVIDFFFSNNNLEPGQMACR